MQDKYKFSASKWVFQYECFLTHVSHDKQANGRCSTQEGYTISIIVPVDNILHLTDTKNTQHSDCINTNTAHCDRIFCHHKLCVWEFLKLCDADTQNSLLWTIDIGV